MDRWNFSCASRNSKNWYFRTIVSLNFKAQDNYMENITATHTATVTDVITGEVETVNLYAVPSNLTAEEFGVYLDALMAQVVA